MTSGRKNAPGMLAQLASPRTPIDLGMKGLKVIKNEGFNGFYFKLKDFLDKNRRYEQFIKKNELTADRIMQCKRDIGGFKFYPVVSVITPVYNPRPAWIRSAIESVMGQIYERWELCIADASTDVSIKKILVDYSKEDPRIKVKDMAENKGISANTNEALSMATGDFIALLDHDDEIAPDALYEVVKYLQSNPHADLIYTDEDMIDLKGRRCEPFFKPGWSPDMLLSIMYTRHLSVYRRRLVEEAGAFRAGYDGSQDYDLTLRFTERTKNIGHIPKVLYHWRMTPGSTSVSIGSKGYANEAAKKALSDYMARNGIKGEVRDGLWNGSYYLKRDLLRTPMVSIIIGTRDHVEALKKCIDSIVARTTYSNYEILVVDNNSHEKETHDYYGKLEGVRNVRVLSYDGAFNLSAINDNAVRHTKGEILLFLSNGTEVIAGEWMNAMLEQAQRKEVGAVGCKLLYPNNTVQHAGIILGINDKDNKDKVAGHSPQLSPRSHHGYVGRESIILNLSAVTAACIMVRKEVFEEVGGFDESLAAIYGDVDLCLRIRQKGYLIVYTPYAVLYHNESLSRGYVDTQGRVARRKMEIRYVRERWGDLIDAGDPYYNPNLTLNAGDFSIRL